MTDRLSVVERDLTGFKGEVLLIKDNETGNHYVVSRADTFDRGDETMVFASDEEGNVENWRDLYAGYGEDIETAIQNFSLVLDGLVDYDPNENIKLHGNRGSLFDGLMMGMLDFDDDTD